MSATPRNKGITQHNKATMQRALNVEQGAAYLGCHPNTFRQLLNDGKVHSYYIGRRRRVLVEDLDAFIADGGAR